MKKILSTTILSLVICTGAGALEIDNCEKFGDAGIRGDWVVKCDNTDKLMQLQADEPAAMFLSAPGGLTEFTDILNDMMADTEHTYINIVPNGCGPDTTEYRILKHNMVEYKSGTPYAVLICE